MIYLDNASSTLISKSVLDSMIPFLKQYEFFYANPNSSHKVGKLLSTYIYESRKIVSELLNAYSPSEIVFTSGATESNNLAILGSTIYSKKKSRNHIITTKIEHVSVLKCFKFLEKNGYEVSYLSVDKNGLIYQEELKKLIKKETCLISLIHVNNETGSVQNLEMISEYIKNKDIIFHVDAVQTIGKIKINLQKLRVDLLSISGHKIYGPKGIGVLFTRLFPRKAKINPIMFGSMNENGLRPGTPFLPQIVGLGTACKDIIESQDSDIKYLNEMKNYFLDIIKKDRFINLNGCKENIAPGILNINIKNIKREQLEELQKKYLFSFGSSCSTKNSSYVLKSMNIDKKKN